MKADMPSPVQPPASVAAASTNTGQTPVARNVILPPSLAGSLDRILIGTVVSQDTRGHVTVETKDGELRFISRMPLQAGSRVTIELQATGTTINAIILSVNGRVMAGGTRATSSSAHPGTMTQVISAGTGGGPPAAGASANAIPQASSPVPHDGEPPLEPGHILQGRLAPQGTPTLDEAAPKQPIAIRILSVTPPSIPGDSQTSIAPRAVPTTGDIPTVTGIATRTAGNGEVVLRTPLGTLSITTPTPVAAGVEVSFEILTRWSAPAGIDRTQIANEIANGWSSLREALTTLKADKPAVAEDLVARVLAQPGPGLAGDLFGYILGLKSRNARSWIGETAASALEQAGRADILSRIGDEFTLMTRLGHETQAGDWRTFLVPLYVGGEVQPLRLFMRKPRAQRESGRDTATRFVVEADLKSLGLLQLDGLSQSKRLDLIVRTREPLAELMRGDIDALFSASCAAAGLDGSIRFQADSVFKVAPLDDIVPHGGSGGVVV